MWYTVYFSYGSKKTIFGDDIIDALFKLTQDEINAITAIRSSNG